MRVLAADSEFPLPKSRSLGGTENSPSLSGVRSPPDLAQGTLSLIQVPLQGTARWKTALLLEKPRDFVCMAIELDVNVPLCLCG